MLSLSVFESSSGHGVGVVACTGTCEGQADGPFFGKLAVSGSASWGRLMVYLGLDRCICQDTCHEDWSLPWNVNCPFPLFKLL